MRAKLFASERVLRAARFLCNLYSQSRDTHSASPGAACARSRYRIYPLPLQRSCAVGRGRVRETWQRGDCENAAPLDSTIQPASQPQCQLQQLARTIFPKQLFMFAAAVEDGGKQCEMCLTEMQKADSINILRGYLPLDQHKRIPVAAPRDMFIYHFILY